MSDFGRRGRMSDFEAGEFTRQRPAYASDFVQKANYVGQAASADKQRINESTRRSNLHFNAQSLKQSTPASHDHSCLGSNNQIHRSFCQFTLPKGNGDELRN